MASSRDKELANAAKIDLPAFTKVWEKYYGKKTAANAAQIGLDFTTYQASTPSDASGVNAPTNTDANRPSSYGDFVRKSIQTQYSPNTSMMGGEMLTVESIGNILFDANNKIKGPAAIFEDILKDFGQQAVLYLQQQNDLLTKTGQKTGILGELSKGFRREISLASIDAVKLGVSFTELSDVVTNVVAESGKFKMLDSKTISDMALVSKFSKDLSTYAMLVPLFEKIGLGVGDMNREITKSGKDALGLGLNARSVVSIIGENLDKINQYGFKKGVQGLSEMAQKSIEFRMNMNQAFALANKVWSPEGALEVVSNLQVIGGAFGDLNDPIKLMYMATNNVEGLQDAIIGASKSLVTFNQEQGRFEVTGANLRRAKEMADQFGMSMGELTTGAVAAMERTQAASDLMSRGLNLKPEQTEFLTNLARMEGGQMVISIPENLRTQLGLEGEQKNIALETLDQTQADMLIREQDKLKDKSMTEIANEQVSLIENINRDLSYLVAIARIQAGEAGRRLAYKYLKFDPEKTIGEIDTVARNMGKSAMKFSETALESDLLRMNKEKQTGTISTGETTAIVDNSKKSGGTVTEAEATTQKITHEHKISVTSDFSSDELRRHIERNPRVVAAEANSFLETY